MIRAGEIGKGVVLLIKNEPYMVVEREFVNPGKGSAFVRLKLKSLITGQVFPVRKSTVIRLGNPSKEIIDLLLYSFRSPKDLIYLPWEDESNEEFEIRAKSYGINLF